MAKSPRSVVKWGDCTRSSGRSNYPQRRGTRPIEAPRRHPCLERRLKGRDQLLKLVEGQAGEIQELRGARLQVGKPSMDHPWCLLSWEAQYTINRDNLKC